MTTVDFITTLFCRVDDRMNGVAKHAQERQRIYLAKTARYLSAAAPEPVPASESPCPLASIVNTMNPRRANSIPKAISHSLLCMTP